MATTDLTISNLAYISERYPSTHYNISSSTRYEIGNHNAMWQQDMLFKLAAFPSNLKHNKLTGIQFRVYAAFEGDAVGGVYVNNGDYTTSSVTWYTQPVGGYIAGRLYKEVDTWSGDIWFPESLSGTTYEAQYAARAVQAPSLRFSANQWTWFMYPVLKAGGSPYARVYYDSTKVPSKIVYASGAVSGYSNPRNPSTFSWNYVKNSSDYCAVESWNQSSASFYWKTSTASTYTEVQCGTSKSVTIAANTFPTNSTIQWYVRGTDEENTTTQTPVYSFSTAAGAASSNCVDPVNQVIDGSADYNFLWNISSTDGQPASRTILNWKKSTDNAWTTIVDEASQLTSYVVAGGTFPAGSIDWQVIPYNIDGVVGTSSQATFISVAAPAAVQGLAATPVPYSTISWQSSEQRAYRVLVDGVEVVKAFGESVYSYQLTEPLSDGDHEITVMVQGQYGYWSQPSTVTITIENVPDSPIMLKAAEDVDVSLIWSTESTTSNFYVYRDGKQIGHTFNTFFADRLAAGLHSYYVINRLSNGYYTKSNIIEARTCFEGARIALLSGGGWMDIRLTEKSATEQSFSYQRKFSARHISGAVYPVLELSPFEDFTGSYDCAFNNVEDALAFEQFRGQTVIVKSRGGKAVAGAITALSSHYGDFLAGYSFSIQQIHIEDYVDDTNA